ncbi:aldehyde dehydrogenase [Pandoraea communis]|uniref:Aldehyde dehydrogenase n=1 Tax=Pandoraea communis TaxID=2508297 RepID=A0A5E4VCI1_9BURK|nr:NAD-dependent succinate-semialdehyde dehydrogenase [Pandoraea communis]VVE09109.1 aldehyde dehydrogenase [Pandoraea communis]
MSHNVELFINGQWKAGAEGLTLPIENPATGEIIGTVARATQPDLDAALAAAEAGFAKWREIAPFERAKLMRKAAGLLRERVGDIARQMTMEQGKPIGEAKGEVLSAADIIEFFAEEGKRAYGRLIPARVPNVYQMVIQSPVGAVAAFTPWNFPVNQVVRKVSAALAAGCSVIVKAAEETPASPAALIRAFADAGLPDGVLNLVYGVPAEISSYLIPHPAVRKVSFTGSTPVGKQLAAMAGLYMKRVTMELGGHAPALIFNDADIAAAVRNLAAGKFRNAGQVCVAPTRFLVQRGVYDQFVDAFVKAAESLRVGNGLDPETTMGPLVNGKRFEAISAIVDDAVANGAQLKTGGKRVAEGGHFYAPTVLCNVPMSAKIMHEEPFGPVAIVNPFDTEEEAIAEANRLPYGLAAYAYTTSQGTAHRLSARIESGMLTINHAGLALPEVPFGGVKDSGYGSEGGPEALEAYLQPKFVTRLEV